MLHFGLDVPGEGVGCPLPVLQADPGSLKSPHPSPPGVPETVLCFSLLAGTCRRRAGDDAY